jgi:hypothetical protein
MVEVLERAMSHIHDDENWLNYLPDGSMSDMSGSMGNITSHYIEDFYRGYSHSDYHDKDWVPLPHGEALDFTNYTTTGVPPYIETWLAIVGSDTTAATQVAADASELMKSAVQIAIAPDLDSGQGGAAASPFGHLIGAMGNGARMAGHEAILDEALLEDIAADRWSRRIDVGTEAIDLPFLGMLISDFADFHIDQLMRHDPTEDIQEHDKEFHIGELEQLVNQAEETDLEEMLNQLDEEDLKELRDEYEEEGEGVTLEEKLSDISTEIKRDLTYSYIGSVHHWDNDGKKQVVIEQPREPN